MSDSFEFTLHSPMTEEDWNILSDVEHENTKSVTFQTPQGKRVKYIKCEVLDKIRAEIEAKCCITVGRGNDGAITLHDVFEIIDKYREEGA